jgi:Cu-Zn family superoxide dismutase
LATPASATTTSSRSTAGRAGSGSADSSEFREAWPDATLAFADKPKPPEPLTIKIIDGNTGDVGTATLKPDPNGGVSIALDLHGLPPGDHAIHIHETAKCQVTPGEPASKSAGAHFNPENKHHGLENTEGPHAGDMKNLTVDAKDKAKTTVTATNVTIEDGPHSGFTSFTPSSTT